MSLEDDYRIGKPLTEGGFSRYDVAYLYDPLTVHHALDGGITEQCSEGERIGIVNVTTGMAGDFKRIFLETLLGGAHG